MRLAPLASVLLGASLSVTPALSQPLVVAADDTVFTPKVVHLSEIAGREFFEAVIDTTRVVAVIVRTK